MLQFLTAPNPFPPLNYATLHPASCSFQFTFVSTADALTMEERALAVAARQALLQQTAKQPVTAAVLWLTCVHLAAYNTLPSQAIHRQVALINLEPWVITQACCPYSCGTSGQTHATSCYFCCIPCHAWEGCWLSSARQLFVAEGLIPSSEQVVIGTFACCCCMSGIRASMACVLACSCD